MLCSSLIALVALVAFAYERNKTRTLQVALDLAARQIRDRVAVERDLAERLNRMRWLAYHGSSSSDHPATTASNTATL